MIEVMNMQYVVVSTVAVILLLILIILIVVFIGVIIALMHAFEDQTAVIDRFNVNMERTFGKPEEG